MTDEILRYVRRESNKERYQQDFLEGSQVLCKMYKKAKETIEQIMMQQYGSQAERYEQQTRYNEDDKK